MSDQDGKAEVVKVLDVPLFAGDIESASRIIVASCLSEGKMNHCVSATGAHGLVFSKQDRDFKDILDSFYLNLPDGMPGVWIGRLKGARHMRRCYGPDFFSKIMRATASLPITHFYCGGNPGVADALKRAVSQKFNNHGVVGSYCPPFLPVSEYDYQSIAGSINETKANVVWIGLSTPKQEQFAHRLSKYLNVNFIITVGAAFDFHVDRVVQAPGFIQRIGMEWFFRLLVEPKRLYKRYMNIVPLFIYYNLGELLSFVKIKVKGK